MLYGYLELFIGPVNSSKTFHLVNKFNEYIALKISVVLINYGGETELTTETIINTERLMDINYLNNKENEIFVKEKSKIRRSNVILIDDGHKYPDLVEFVSSLLKDNKHVYICGLDGDSERNKIGNILDLIPLCDNVNKLKSFCNKCKNGTPGIFTKSTKSGFISVCRQCY